MSDLETTSAVVLPKLTWVPSPNTDPRYNHPVNLVVAHRWGARNIPVSEPEEKISYGGVINWFKETESQVSAHFVFPGSAASGKATQMVAYDDYAWAEAAYNPGAVEVESADDIWVGKDTAGLAVMARIFGFLLHKYDLPPVWSTTKGFCRHADLGAAGGGHTECPTTDLTLWKHFVSLTQEEYHRGGYIKVWGR